MSPRRIRIGVGAALFTRSEAMIRMRDGVPLCTEIVSPKNAAGRLPILFERTPYGALDDEQGIARAVRGFDELIGDSYILVFQDIRGRYKSEGQFVMQRQPRADRNDPTAIGTYTMTNLRNGFSKSCRAK